MSARPQNNTGPWKIGERVLVRNTYPGTVSGHRGPSYMVKLDREVSGLKVVLCNPDECRLLPKQRKHATCAFCPKVLVSCGGGVRMSSGTPSEVVICSSSGPCFRSAQAAIAAKN